jgi:hypothetical protein
MDHTSRMARTAASVLVNIAQGRGLLGVRTARRAVLVKALEQATGCTRGTGRDRHDVHLDGRPVSHDMPEDMRRRMGASMVEWMSRGDPDGLEHEPASLPQGAREIMTRCGVDVTRTLVMLEALHHVAFDGPSGAAVTMRTTTRGPTLEYERRGVVLWRDGMVSIKHGPIPASVAAALTGATLGRIVDDAVLADRPIRKVCDVDPRDARLRIVTMDEGRRLDMTKGKTNG